MFCKKHNAANFFCSLGITFILIVCDLCPVQKFSAKVKSSEAESEVVEVKVLDESVMYLTTWETAVWIFSETLSYKWK